MDHQRFIEARRMTRLREIICEILDGGEVVVKVWVGFGVTLVFLEIFWDFSGKGKRTYSVSRVYLLGARTIFCTAQLLACTRTWACMALFCKPVRVLCRELALLLWVVYVNQVH